MSPPLGFFRSVLVSSRHRICGLLRRLPPHGRRHATAAATALTGLAGSASLYLKQDAERSADISKEETITAEEKAMRRRFEAWMVQYGRAYSDEEEKAARYEIFSRTARFVDEQNARPGPRLSSCGTNKFADMTQEEFSWCHGGVRVTEDELAGLRRDRARLHGMARTDKTVHAS